MICTICNRPMIVIKATTGILGWNQGHQYEREVKDPIRLYKCEGCGKLIEEPVIKIEVR